MSAGPIYLQHHDGEALGPLPMRALEVLYDSRIIDDDTPISQDGVNYLALRDLPVLHTHVLEVKKQLVSGENPWAEALGDGGDPGGDALATADVVGPAGATPVVEATRPLAAMLKAAAGKAMGHLTLSSAAGAVTIYYKDGKVAALATNIPELSLGSYLVNAGVATEAAVARAEDRAEQMGGDFGAALIGLGAVPPHAYFEKFVAWSKSVLGSLVSSKYDDAFFQEDDVPNPPVPLGLDRFGIIIDIVRENTTLELLQERLLPQKNCVLIPSQVEGAGLEDLKLKPRELRTINAINGTKSLAELIDTLGGNDQKVLEILQVVYFGIETGVTVLGPDPTLAKEASEVARLRDVFEALKDKDHFEVLGVKESSSDEETRARYTELVKQYHPDTLRQGCHPDLLELRRELFGRVTSAFEVLQTAQGRSEYATALKEGRKTPDAEQEKVRAVLQAETLFKKAEVFARMRKYDEAVSHLEQAIGLNGEDLEFKIHLTYYSFLRGGYTGDELGVHAEKAVKAINALIKGHPPILAAHLFLAQILKLLNRPDQAVKQFNKVLEIDGKHIEAMREVRLYNTRLEQEKKKKKSLF